jgi:hypothetical protein
MATQRMGSCAGFPRVEPNVPAGQRQPSAVRCTGMFEPHSGLSATTPVVGPLPLMRHGQNHQEVFTSLVDEAERKLGEYQLADIVGDLQTGVEILSNSRKPGVDFVSEDQS